MKKYSKLFIVWILTAGALISPLYGENNLPNLRVENISFSNDRPEQEEEITINAEIQNTGSSYSNSRFIDHEGLGDFWPIDGYWGACSQSFYYPTDMKINSVSLFAKNNDKNSENNPLTVKILKSTSSNGVKIPDKNEVIASVTCAYPYYETTYKWLDFKFDDHVSLSKNTTYWIVAESAAEQDKGYNWIAEIDTGTFKNGNAVLGGPTASETYESTHTYTVYDDNWAYPDSPYRDLFFRVYRPTVTVVEFFDGDPKNGGEEIAVKQIPPVPGRGGTMIFSSTYSFVEGGEKNIFIIVNLPPHNYIVESSTAGNKISKNIITVYGAQEANIFESETGKIRVSIPAGAFNKNYYIILQEDPHKESDIQTLISEADRKLRDDSDPFSRSIEDHYFMVSAYYADDTPAGGDLKEEAQVEFKYDEEKLSDSRPDIDSDYLKLLRLNEKNRLWTRVSRYETDKDNNLVRATVDGFSVFSISGTGAGDLSQAHPYPVPFLTDRHEEITFTNLTPSAEIKIYTLSGRHIKTISHTGGNEAIWENPIVASGTYLYIIKNDSDTSKGKLMIIR